MLFQSDFSRLFIIFVPQPLLSIIFLTLAFMLLRRKRERTPITLSLWYLSVGIGLILNAIYALITEFFPTNEILIYFLYFTSFYLITISSIFLLMFIVDLIKSEFTIQKLIFFVILYCSLSAVIVFLSGGITLDSVNNWRPVFSWFFFILLASFYTITILIPTIYYSVKLYSFFQAQNLKKKYRNFMIGVFGMLIVVYGAALFNTWQNDLFQSIWSIITFCLITPSAFLIYFGIGTKL